MPSKTLQLGVRLTAWHAEKLAELAGDEKLTPYAQRLLCAAIEFQADERPPYKSGTY